MKLKYEFVIRSVAGESFAVPIGEAVRVFPGMITLNGIGAFIMEKLSTETTEAELVDAVLERYDVDKETAQKDVHDYLDKLNQMGLM